jgi:hypothetical protein
MKYTTHLSFLDNKDHDFASYLRKMGWKGEWKKVNGNTNYFMNPHGSVIAKAVYNNNKSTFKVYI